MTRARFKTLPTLIIAIVIGVAIGVIAAYAKNTSAEPTSPTAYAEYRSDR